MAVEVEGEDEGKPAECVEAEDVSSEMEYYPLCLQALMQPLSSSLFQMYLIASACPGQAGEADEQVMGEIGFCC